MARRREGDILWHNMRLCACPLSQRAQEQTLWATCDPTWLKNFARNNTVCRPCAMMESSGTRAGTLSHGELPGKGWCIKDFLIGDKNHGSGLPFPHFFLPLAHPPLSAPMQA